MIRTSWFYTIIIHHHRKKVNHNSIQQKGNNNYEQNRIYPCFYGASGNSETAEDHVRFAPQSRPPLRSGKLTAEKKKPSETLTERFRELAVIRFNRVCVGCGMLHNA